MGSRVVFITSPVGSFKGALVTEKIREKRDALVSEEASWWGVLKSREPGLSLALLPSGWTLFEREGSSSVLPLSGLSLSPLSIVTSPPGSPGEGVPKEPLSPPSRLTLLERKG